MSRTFYDEEERSKKAPADAGAGIATRLTRTLVNALGYAKSLVPSSIWKGKLPATQGTSDYGKESKDDGGGTATATATATAAGAGAGAFPARSRMHSLLPSLFEAAKNSLGGSSEEEDVLMQAVETWPASRVDVLLQVRTRLKARLAALRELSASAASEIVLTDIFGRMRPLGRGRYGTVSIGCLRKDFGSGCEQFVLDVHNVGRREVTVFLAVKTTRTPERVLAYMSTQRDLPVFSATTRDGLWFGNVNSMREVLLGRFLNHLVQAGVTPHFPMVYETFEITPGRGNVAIVMELCHMDFDTFLEQVLPRVPSPVLRMHMLRIALMQMAHGLAAAQLRLNFRHNDLHSKNAMMTFITNTVYTYVIDGVAYAVPNLGMCWKLTDFGFGSSEHLFEKTDTVNALLHTGAARKITETRAFPAHAVEAVDFLRLVRIARQSGVECGFKPQVDYCTRLEADIHELAQKIPTARGSVRAFSAGTSAHASHGVSELLSLSRSNGLMTDVFILLATTLVVGPEEAEAMDGPTYDINARLYRDGLTGIEKRYYAVHSSGILLKKK